jgi:hypothetical protein
MPRLFPLKQLESFNSHELQEAIDDTPEFERLRDAVGEVVRAIHGLPTAIGCELRQLEVYLGRTGRDADLLRNRWQYRFKQFKEAPSTHALALFRSSTAQLRNESWERAAQRVVGALDRNKALCCANVVAGNNGPWPSTRQSTIYLVARVRPGPVGELSSVSVDRAIRELMDEQDIDPAALVEAGRLIPRQEESLDIEIAEVADDSDTEILESSAPICREQGCKHRGRDRNFGFCGHHRRTLPADQRCRSSGCLYAPLPKNYGFCGVHREL